MNIFKKKYPIALVLLLVSFTLFFVRDFVLAANPRNNDNFINDSFWKSSPTNTQIKEAIFGNASDNKTAYTQERNSNPCSTGTINIVNVQNYAVSGINTLSQSLIANTIYVLNSGTYITSGQINYSGNCSAVIGKGIVKIYSSVSLNSGTLFGDCMFKSKARSNVLLSNINIDGLQDGLGTYRNNGNSSSGNSYGIYFYDTKNSTINALGVYNNRQGMQIEMAENNLVTNSLAYNNLLFGVYLYGNSKPNYVINNQMFNNNGVGLGIKNSQSIFVNNTQVYNNYRGITLENANSGSISNCMVYNNNQNGILLQINSSNNIINNCWVFNNTNTGLYMLSGLGNTYYGSIKLFNNSSTTGANTMQGMTAGSSGDSIVSGLGRSNGTVDTGFSVGYPYITNPKTNDGRNLLSGTSWSSTNRSFKGRTGIEFVSFTYGTGLIKQIRNINYGTPSLGFSNVSYDSNKYIAQLDFTNNNPDGFTFENITGAVVNQIYTSNIITLTGMDSATEISVTLLGRGTILKNGVNIGTGGTGTNGDQFSIQITSSSNYYTLRSGSLVVGSTSADFTITTTAEQIADTTPDSFSFAPITGASLNTLYTSNIITLTGIDISQSIPVTLLGRGTVFKNGVNIGTGGTGTNGDQFFIQITSSSNYYTLRSGHFSLGSVSTDFTLTTAEEVLDTTPDSFSFTPITGVALNTLYTSNIITLTGIHTGLSITASLTGRGTILKNGVNIGTGGTGTNGDQFSIQITSSSNYYTLRSGHFSLGSVSADFTLTTAEEVLDTTFPIFSGVITGTTYNAPLSITFSDANLSGATLNGSPYTNGTIISAEGDYVFVVSDTAGNSTGASFRISIPKTITITFDAPISTGTVIKAPVKYNKDVAYSFTYDDGIIDGYQPVFKYSEGGQITGGGHDFVAPGLYYTDGAGNDVAFKGAYAWYSLNATFGDKHINTPSSITRTQLAETYINGRDILNHSLRHITNPATGTTYDYPDNPPGTTGLDYPYEIRKNDEYVRDHIGLSGVHLTHFVTPSGETDYIQPARDLGYKSLAHQSYTNGLNGLDVFNYTNLYHLMMHRKYFTSQTYDFSNITDDIDSLMVSGSTATIKLRRQASTHGVPLSGIPNGGMDFPLWQYLMDSIANNYGKNGTDKIRVAGSQEVYEYLTTKQGTNISTIVSGNQMIINLDTLSLSGDLRRKALSLVITGTNANISSIAYQNGAFTYHSENKTGGLINLEMGEYYPTDRNPDSFSLGNQSNANRGQVYTSSIITLTGMSPGLDNIIYLSGVGTLYKNGASIGNSSTGRNGDQFYVRLTSSENGGETISTIVNIGLQSQTYAITTNNDISSVPNTFTFVDQAGVELNSLYTSNIITIAGMSSNMFTGISVNGGYMLKNGNNIGRSGTGGNSDQFVVVLTSSIEYATTVNATMTMGGTHDTFSISTKANIPSGNPWNNDYFINDSFWRSNPTNTQIKEAIFGNAGDHRTAYTQERISNPCSTGTINIVNIQNYAVSGINSLPQLLSANTIYVLNSGMYITSGQIYYNGNCSAVIGKGTTTIYSSVVLNSGATNSCIFKSTGKDHIILSDIQIDGLQDGLGTYRFAGNLSSGNSYGAYFFNIKNGSIHGVSFYNNRIGLQIETAESVVTTNVLSYNNGVYGVQILSSPKSNYITNTQIFNNNSVGLNITNSTGQVLNNLQVYNNVFQGIILSNVNNSIVSNCMSYNNMRYGLRFQSNSSNNIINNSWFYNNSTTGVFVESGIGNTYYGSIKLFNNSNTSSANTLVGGISAGSSGDTIASGLSRSDGTMDTGLSVGYPYITNPQTNDGRYLISGSARSSTNRGRKNRTGFGFVSFTYGTGLLKQISNIHYAIPSLGLSNIFHDTNRYIAETNFTNTSPDGFAFTNIIGVNLHQSYTSNIITLTGMDTGTFEYVTLTGRGTIFKNGVDIGTSGTGSNGDEFSIQILSSTDYATLRSGSLIIGTTSADFTLTTLAQVIDNVPNDFSFVVVTGASVNTVYTSNIVLLTGMDSAAVINVSLTGQGIVYKNGVSIGISGTGKNNDQFNIQMISSSNYNTTTSGTFLANSITASFVITTQLDLIFPSFSGVITGTTYNEPLSITFSDSNLSGATLNGSPYTNGTMISAEGDYIFVVSDTAGNSTGASFRISIPKTITITFDAPISTGTVIKAPVKYNKDVAYGMVFDDGLDDGYQPAFKYLAGGQISGWNNNFIAPGLYFTDGAGNDVAFKGGYARYSVNSAFSDLHINTPSYIKWAELKETYTNGWDIFNHGWSSAAYPASGQLYNYPDNPPGTTGLDYVYEITKAYEYVRDRIGLSGVYLTHFILPSGDQGYTQPARDQGYKSVSAQGIGTGANGINIYSAINLYHFQMNRKYTTSQNSDPSNVTNDIDALMANSSGATTKLWRHAFTHGIVFTGNNNGGMDFSLWKFLMDHMADVYGKKGSDKIRFAGPQEVYEYLATKQGTNVSTIVSGNQLIINLDTLNVPSDLRREALSLLVTGTNANISAIAYQNGAFTYHSENKTGGLINLEMSEYYPTDRNPDSFSLGNQGNATVGQAYNSNTITLTGMSPGLDNIIYLSGAGTIYKNGVNKGNASTGKNGDQFYVRLTSSNNEGEAVSTMLNIGLQTQTYTVITQIHSSENDIIDLPSSSSESTMNDTLIASGYTNGTGSIKANLNIFVVGTKRIRTRDSAGKILAPVIMQSSGISNKIEAQIPAGTTVKKTNDALYTGIINVPVTKPIETITSLNSLISAASFGSTGESINFVDSGNTPIDITIRMPAPGKNSGDIVNIYYSQDNGSTRNFHGIDTVESINGEPYVEFTTNHFTDFAITLPGGNFTGAFIINGDFTTTTSTTVTLNISTTPPAIQMRFSNTSNVGPWSDWGPYSTTTGRTLSPGYASKIVYAEFDANGDGTGDVVTSDSINYVAPGGSPTCAPGSQCGDLTLQIISGYSYCDYGTTLDFGDTGHSYLSRSLITGFQTTGKNDAWFCEDNQGLANWALSIESSDILNITTNNPLHTIPASSVFVRNPNAYRAQGICTHSSGASLNQRTGILTPKAILGKLGNQGEGCKIITDNVDLKVDLTGSQALGVYSGTITISLPNF